MYQAFFGLEKCPFHMTPDASCVYMTAQHVEAISGLVYGVLNRRGYLLLTGEAGLGKTTALTAALQLGGPKIQSSLILNPILSAAEFLETVMLDFGIDNIPASKAQRLRLLQDFLLRGDSEGKISVVVVDEAHKLSVELLEEIRLLGNFDFSDHKLLQIILVGQNELGPLLNRSELRQLKQRIAIRLSLHPLDSSEIGKYIQFRWERAGGKSMAPFTPEAITAVAHWSKGIPRLMNAICDNALLIAFAEESRTVGLEQIREAAGDLDLLDAAPTPFLTSSVREGKPPATAPGAASPAASPIPARPGSAAAAGVPTVAAAPAAGAVPGGYRLPSDHQALRGLASYGPQRSFLTRWFRWASPAP